MSNLNKIILSREAYYFSNYKKTSHIQFQIQYDNKLLSNYLCNVVFTRENNNIGNITTAVWNSNTGYYDVIFTEGIKKLEIYKSGYNSINGIYLQESSSLYIKRDNENNPIAYLFLQNDIWYLGLNSTFGDGTGIYFKSQTNSPVVLPPRQFISLNANDTSQPQLIWLQNIQNNSLSDIYMEIVSLSEIDDNSSSSSDSVIGQSIDVSNFDKINVKFVTNEYESANADYYEYETIRTQEIIDCFDDNIIYKNPKQLALYDIPIFNKQKSKEFQYTYSVQLFNKLNNSSSSSSSNDLSLGFPQRVCYLSENNASLDSNVFNNITAKFGTSHTLFDYKMKNHLCKHYIVQANYTGNTGWLYRLYEGVKYGRKNLTFSYLKSLTNINEFVNLSEIQQDFNLDKLTDDNYRIQYDDNNKWWNIIDLQKEYEFYNSSSSSQSSDSSQSSSSQSSSSQSNSSQSSSSQSNSSQSSSQETINDLRLEYCVVGRIIDYNYYIQNAYSSYESKAITGIKIKAISYNGDDGSSTVTYENEYRYKIFFGNSWLSHFDTFCKNNLTISKQNFYMKGKLITCISPSNSSFGNYVDFYYKNKFLFSFNFDCEQVLGVHTIQYVIHDQEYVIPYENGGNCYQYCQTSKEAIISGQQILNYFNKFSSPQLNYLNDLYMINATCYNGYGDMYFAYLNECQIVYFSDDLTLKLNNSSTAYINSSTHSSLFNGNILYGDENDEINDHEIPFSKVQVSEQFFSDDLICSSSSSEEFDYPYIENDVTSLDVLPNQTPVVNSQKIYINYNKNKLYNITLPYGKAPEIDRQKIYVEKITNYSGTQFLGYYQLLTYTQVNERLVSADRTVYTDSTYVGTAKIYQILVNDSGSTNGSSSTLKGGNYYIQFKENRWTITTNLNSTSYVAQAHHDDTYYDYKTDIIKALSNLHVINANSYNCVCTSSFINAQTQHGKYKNVYIRLTDKYGNKTNVVLCKMSIYMTLPYDLSLKLTGSDGSSYYTGFYKKYNRYFPSQFITVDLSAKSGVKLSYKLSGSMFKNDTSWIQIQPSVNYSRVIKIKSIDMNENILNKDDANIDITLRIKDEAGNENKTSNKIRYISKLFRAKHVNLLSESSSYSHQLYSVQGTTNILMSPKRISSTEYTRSWNEIWYPSTHGSPLNDDGTINETEALRIAQTTIDSYGKTGPTSLQLLMYDRLALDGNKLATDSEGRFYQKNWDVTKTYGSMQNNRISNNSYPKYWVIDNTGNVDFKIEFQYFDFSNTVTTLPANLVAPYKGDMVTIYDASNKDCVRQYIDSYGNTKYELIDASKLSHICTLKGSYLDTQNNNPFTMIDSTLNGTLTTSDHGFTLPSITQCSRICIVPFTDYGDGSDSVASGFKIKAGPKHAVEYSNYDYINNTGQFWVHQSPQVASATWDSCDGLKLIYKYYATIATTDQENGIVLFDKRSDYPILCTFVYFLYLEKETNHYPYGYFSCYNEDNDTLLSHTLHSFVMSQDDIVDYTQPSFYVVPSGVDYNTSQNYSYTDTEKNEGKLYSGYTLVKDTGILTFVDKVPLGRILGDYFYHTFYRLTSDGYGDLYFYGSGILVPAPETTQYKDWTYVDLKIVNEGTNSLSDGILQFLARGYVTKGTVVDTVLDQNRPWDIQQGTTAQTVQRTGAQYKVNYSQFSKSPTRQDAYKAREKQTCTFGTLDAKSQIYVRVYWCLANNAQGTEWVDSTRGAKCFSAQLSGIYYVFTTGS